jgi:membrane associated rhomboid family serine protease
MGVRDPDEVTLRRARSRARVEEWALVLAAEGLAPSVRSEEGAFVLCLPARQGEHRERALQALEAYERENPPDPEREATPAPTPRTSRAGTLAAATLVAFFFVTGPRFPGNPWFQAGSADAARILAGEVWRVATALTLHADLAHVVANAVMGALLVNAVCGTLGSGLGLAAVLLAGMGGNGINALVHTASHDSVGASTAVFAALGLLCGPALSRHRRRGARGRRLLAPLGAGLGLIAMLGVGGAQTDIWAHLFGFAVGVVLGLPLAFTAGHAPGRPTQWACGALAVAITLGSWSLAGL